MNKICVVAEIRPSGKESLFSVGGPVGDSVFRYELPPPLFRELDLLGTHFNLLIVEQAPQPAWKMEESPSGLEIISPLGDPSNLGALLRTATAFGVRRVILTRESAHPFHPKCIKASAGTVFHIPLFRAGPLSEVLAVPMPGLHALDLDGTSLAEYAWPRDARLVIGEEGPGLPKTKHLAKILSLPLPPEVESLNATVAASLAIYSYRLQQPRH
jgi:TrmH family RNA methyltransferase